ncbi:RNA-guided endonuclease InsQ/TnpB family protein [Nonomuraea dietziae]|uniref:RNA-guided endonuclease InsQ/TnpB family protein n=1 Tax=Nonomuraea dietziae TaxID=65515 RepID=UPI0033F8902A
MIALAFRQSGAGSAGLPSVIQLRLDPTPEDAVRLAAAMALCNEAATFVSRLAWSHRTFDLVALHRLAYYEARASLSGLGAQAAVKAVTRVVAAYANRRASKKRAHVFRPHGAVPFDVRMISFRRDARVASIWTPQGRVRVGYQGRAADLKMLDTLPVGEVDLMRRRGVWLLKVSVTLPPSGAQAPVNGFLGVDQGIANLAVTSDGVVLPGAALPGTIGGNAHVRAIRARRHRQRQRLQRKKSSSARRVLRRMSGREHRMMTDVNHQISRHMVRETERPGRGIAMEHLHGIRGRVRAHRSQRRTLHSWAFAQQIAFTRYKAARLGIAFVLVDPAYTSQRCPECGCVAKANRPARGRFLCTRCRLAGHADHIAARNIAQRAVASWGAVNRPHATGLPSARRDRESKPSGSTEGS